MNNPFLLTDKNILVTGASSGIGAAVAVACSKMGADVHITGRNRGRLQEIFYKLEGDRNKQTTADLTNAHHIEIITNETVPLDGLVICAGINDKALVKFITEEKIDRIFKINFFAPVLLIRSLLKRKLFNKGASVVFVSSISAFYPVVSNAVYAASKGALNSFFKVMALEVANNQIRVNAIQPGIIQTNILQSYDLQDELSSTKALIPLARFGNTEDVAHAAIYLLSDAAAYVTGSFLTIDGGMSLRAY